MLKFVSGAKALMASLCLVISAFSVMAAEKVDMRTQGKLYQQVTESFNVGQALGLTANGGLDLVRENTDWTTGLTHRRFNQTYMGIPIWGEGLVVARDASTGEVTNLYGNMVQGLESDVVSTTPSFSAAKALADMKAHHAGPSISGKIVSGSRQAFRLCGI